MLDNYEPETNVEEEQTDEDAKEEVRFINSLMNTALMKKAHRFLVKEGKAPEDEEEFKYLLHDIWFGLYSRSANEE